MLVLAQLTGTPLSMLINAVMSRYLGPEDFGVLYLAWTFVTFAALGAEWGQASALPSMVAKDRSRAGELLGSGLVWRWGVDRGLWPPRGGMSPPRILPRFSDHARLRRAEQRRRASAASDRTSFADSSVPT